MRVLILFSREGSIFETAVDLQKDPSHRPTTQVINEMKIIHGEAKTNMCIGVRCGNGALRSRFLNRTIAASGHNRVTAAISSFSNKGYSHRCFLLALMCEL